MPLDKMNMFWNRQNMPQESQLFQPVVPGQYGGDYYTRMIDQSYQKFAPTMGERGSSRLTPAPGTDQLINGVGVSRTRGMSGWNTGWGAGPQNPSGQGCSTPGYPPQSFGQQPQMKPIPHAQGFPFQGFPAQGSPLQGYVPQGYNQGYGGQMPLQPAWEEPKKGGIKGFISNLMAKRKR